MGFIKHDAIVVTGMGYAADKLEEARDKALDLGLSVSGITERVTNGYSSFLIAPDGSKEGWDTSCEMKRARESWMSWARSMDCHGLEWVHVAYGLDLEGACYIKDHNG